MRDAFIHYLAALTERDDKARAELMLLANLEIGFHEQTRLQPEIREAMDAPMYEPGALRRRLMDELFPNPTSQWRLAAARLTGQADRCWPPATGWLARRNALAVWRSPTS